MAETIERQLRGLVLSAIELGGLSGWPGELIEDYLNIIENLILLASNVTDVSDFKDGAVLFMEDELLQEDDAFSWDNTSKSLSVGGRDVIRYGRRNC